MLQYVLYWYVNIDMKVVLVGFWVGSCVQVAPPVMIRAVAEAGCTIVTMITYPWAGLVQGAYSIGWLCILAHLQFWIFSGCVWVGVASEFYLFRVKCNMRWPSVKCLSIHFCYLFASITCLWELIRFESWYWEPAVLHGLKVALHWLHFLTQLCMLSKAQGWMLESAKLVFIMHGYWNHFLLSLAVYV